MEANLHTIDYARIGRVTDSTDFVCRLGDRHLFSQSMDAIAHAFKHPLDLDGSMTGVSR